MKDQRKLPGYSRTLLLIVALLLPTVSLVPLGGLWLWQHGYVVYWGLATCIVVTGLYYLEKRLIAGPAPITPRPEESTDAVCRHGVVSPAIRGLGRRHCTLFCGKSRALIEPGCSLEPGTGNDRDGCSPAAP